MYEIKALINRSTEKNREKPAETASAGGYFTLEACILVPLTFFLFVLVIHLAFFGFGRALITQDCYAVALRAGLLRDGEDRGSFISGNSAWQLGEKYFGNTRPSVTGKSGSSKVTVQGISQTNRGAYDLAAADVWAYSASAEAMDMNIPLRIRRADRIADLAVSAYDALKSD